MRRAFALISALLAFAPLASAEPGLRQRIGSGDRAASPSLQRSAAVERSRRDQRLASNELGGASFADMETDELAGGILPALTDVIEPAPAAPAPVTAAAAPQAEAKTPAPDGRRFLTWQGR